MSYLGWRRALSSDWTLLQIPAAIPPEKVVCLQTVDAVKKTFSRSNGFFIEKNALPFFCGNIPSLRPPPRSTPG
jgi:hypothetical protein